MTKYIFITGGVVSGLGKGITAASLGRLLKARGLKVAAQKLDPYINVDPGTMSPYQHGEVYVTEDGTETDLEFDYGFVCLGMRANAPILQALYDTFGNSGDVEIMNIGDSVRARRIIEGTTEGRNILGVLERREYL